MTARRNTYIYTVCHLKFQEADVNKYIRSAVHLALLKIHLKESAFLKRKQENSGRIIS